MPVWCAFSQPKNKRCTDFNALFICTTIALFGPMCALFRAIASVRHIIGAIDWSRYRNNGRTVQLLTNCSASNITEIRIERRSQCSGPSMHSFPKSFIDSEFESWIQKLCSLCGQTCESIDCVSARTNPRLTLTVANLAHP